MDPRDYFRQARKQRGLSCQNISDMLADRGLQVSRVSLANYELHRSERVRGEAGQAINNLIMQWQREDAGKLAGRARETSGYEADHQCLCGAIVPGPLAGAKFCLACGYRYPVPTCKCGFVLSSTEYRFCPSCGEKVE